MLKNVYECLNAHSNVYLSKVYFCKMYPDVSFSAAASDAGVDYLRGWRTETWSNKIPTKLPDFPHSSRDGECGKGKVLPIMLTAIALLAFHRTDPPWLQKNHPPRILWLQKSILSQAGLAGGVPVVYSWKIPSIHEKQSQVKRQQSGYVSPINFAPFRC